MAKELHIIARGHGSVPLVNGFIVDDEMRMYEVENCIKVSPKTVLGPSPTFAKLIIGQQFFTSAESAIAHLQKSLDDRAEKLKAALENNAQIYQRLEEIKSRYQGDAVDGAE